MGLMLLKLLMGHGLIRENSVENNASAMDKISWRKRVESYFKGDDRTNYERMISGDHYIADDPEIIEKGKRAVMLSGEFNERYAQDPEGSQEILNRLLGSVGTEVYIRGPIYVDYGSFITVGDRTFINMGLTALDVAPIVIGEDCQIGPNVQLLTPTHPVDPMKRRDKLEAGEPIIIGNNVWLGGGVIVCPGVSIGDNTVIGAGSVVVKNIPANVVAVGNPARVVKENI